MTINELMESVRLLPERIDYHPEALTGRHIALVMLKAMISTGNRDIVITALVHDLFKAQDGEMNELTGGWSNPMHPEQACDWLQTTEGNTLLYNLRAKDKNLISDLVRHHMKNKEGKVSKSCMQIPFIDVFAWCDDMKDRWEMDFTVELHLPRDSGQMFNTFYDAHITRCNMSPVQVINKHDAFTLTVNRHPLTYKFESIPDFFGGEWIDFRPYLMQLL